MDLERRRGSRRYVDVQAEGAPRFPGEEEDDEELDGDLADSEREESEPEQEESTATVRPREETGDDEPPAVRPRRAESEASTEPMREPSMLGSPASNTNTLSTTGTNLFVEVENPKSEPFRAEQGEVYYNGVLNNFYIRKKRPDEEIQVKNLSSAAQKLFLSEKGSRAKEWKSVQTSGGQGEPAVVVHRGKQLERFDKSSLTGYCQVDGMRNGKTWETTMSMDCLHLCSPTKEYQHITGQSLVGLSKDSTTQTLPFSTAQCLHLRLRMSRFRCRCLLASKHEHGLEM